MFSFSSQHGLLLLGSILPVVSSGQYEGCPVSGGDEEAKCYVSGVKCHVGLSGASLPFLVGERKCGRWLQTEEDLKAVLLAERNNPLLRNVVPDVFDRSVPVPRGLSGEERSEVHEDAESEKKELGMINGRERFLQPGASYRITLRDNFSSALDSLEALLGGGGSRAAASAADLLGLLKSRWASEKAIKNPWAVAETLSSFRGSKSVALTYMSALETSNHKNSREEEQRRLFRALQAK